MKQTLFMIALTAFGAVGAFAVEPFVGVAVYYFFAVLRPQYLWKWVLPQVGWSGYVAWSTLAATIWWSMSGGGDSAAEQSDARRLTFAHKVFLAFGFWICLTYITAQNRDAAWPWFLEYIKIFLMFGVASFMLREQRHVWWIYRLSAIALIYIAYELNYVYFTAQRVDIYRNGYGGLDNNGAGLMLAMGIPLAIHAWEGTKKVWRWAYIAGVPLILHAVLMSYSRGAMVSLIVAVPFLIVRSKKKKQFSLVLLLLVMLVPYLAGNEIRARFFTVEDYNDDASANLRFESWQAAIDIANDFPIFGVGIRNSNLISFQYGADMEGRTIHSQYLQTLADSGYPALFLYLLALASTWFSLRRCRKALKGRTDGEAMMARSMLSGVEGSLVVFCVGAAFLSLEVFELPYIVCLIGIQVSMLIRTSVSEAPASALPMQPPVFSYRPPALRRGVS